MRIEKAQINELQSILDLQYVAYQSEAKLLNNPNIPPLKQTLEEVRTEYIRGTILKAVDDSNVIVGSVRAYCEDGIVHIGKLMVNPAYQGKGIGSLLLTSIEKEYINRIYELFTSNKSVRNIALYERLGYSVYSEKKISDELTFIYLRKGACCK